eukprot:Skav232440  [mRNA]  locus=scaffold189:306619:307167:- [translate_table: standard]
MVKTFAARSLKDVAIPGPPRPQSRLTALVSALTEELLASVTAHRAFVLRFAAVLLPMRAMWLESTCLRARSSIRDELADATQEEIMLVVWQTMLLVPHLGLGVCALSTNKTGPKKFFLVKPLLPQAQWAAAALAFERENYKGFSEEEIRAKRLANAPVVVFPDFPEAPVRACITTLEAWGRD